MSELNERELILVAGMHRSGTSLITRCLNIAGAQLPKSLLLPVANDNDKGFWESQLIMEFNDRVLQSRGSHWAGVTQFPDQWYESDDAKFYRDQLVEIIDSEVEKVGTSIIKDPRISILFPLWRAALREMRIEPKLIIALRNPLEIARSLELRNGIRLDYSMILWFDYLMTLSRDSQGCKRNYVTFEQVLNDPIAEIENIAGVFGLNLDTHRVEDELTDFLDPSLRHHHIDNDDFFEHKTIDRNAKELYRSLLESSKTRQDHNLVLEELKVNFEDNDFSRISSSLLSTKTQGQEWIAKAYSLMDELIIKHQQELDSKSKALAELSKRNLAVTKALENLRNQEKKLFDIFSRLERGGDAVTGAAPDDDNKLLDKAQRLVERYDFYKRELSDSKELVNQLKIADSLNQASLVDLARLRSDHRDLNRRIGELRGSAAFKIGSRLMSYARRYRASYFSRCIQNGVFLLSGKYFEARTRVRDVKLVEQSGLFDEEFYLSNYPSLAFGSKPPLMHYIENGESEGRQPNPIFDPYFYNQFMTEEERVTRSPLAHFVEIGSDQLFDPSPMFSMKLYKQSKEIGDENPLLHYLRVMKQTPEGGAEILTNLTEHKSTLNREISLTKLEREVRLLVSSIEAQSLEEKLSRLSFRKTDKPLVSIIIPFYGKTNYTIDCLYSLSLIALTNAEIILVDDASTEDCSPLEKISGMHFLKNEENIGYLKSCNRGAEKAKGDILIFLNNDTLLLDGWLSSLVETLESSPKAGLVGSLMLDEKAQIQEAGGFVFNDGSGWNFGRGERASSSIYEFRRNTDYCSGASIAIKKELWQSIGGYDERYVPAYYEDTDLAMQVRQKGYNVIYDPFSRLVHHEGVSCGTDETSGIKKYQAINQKRFLDKWRAALNKENKKPSPDQISDYARKRHASKWLLWIDATTPTPDRDSGSIDTVNFFEQAVSDGWGVTFLPWESIRHDGKYTEHLQKTGVECITGPEQSAEQCVLNMDCIYDVVVLSRLTVARDALSLVQQKFPKAKIVFNTVDLHYMRYKREAELFEKFPNKITAPQDWREAKKQEFEIIKQADTTIVVSDAESELISKECPDASVNVIPLFREVIGAKKGFSQRQNIGFIGGYQHPPNSDAVIYFVKEVWPLLQPRLGDCKFVIAGSNVTPEVKALASGDIEVRGFVEDLSGFLDEMRVMVAPLRYGAGIKGKIVSGLCHGVPQVTSPTAVDGMGLSNKVDVYIGASPQEMADHVAKLYTEQSAWEDVSIQAIRTATRLYSKDVIKKKVTDLLSQY